jgi:hypothetical protein
MSVTFLSVRTKATEMMSEISGTPVSLIAKHRIQRISFVTYKSHCETFSDKESSSTELLIELMIIVLSVSV